MTRGVGDDAPDVTAEADPAVDLDAIKARGESMTTTIQPEEFTTIWDDETTLPFTEGESCDITGYGHQDKAEFAAAINRYDELATGETADEDDKWSAENISHEWVVPVPPDGEYLTRVPEGTPGAIPVTTLWGQR